MPTLLNQQLRYTVFLACDEDAESPLSLKPTAYSRWGQGDKLSQGQEPRFRDDGHDLHEHTRIRNP